MWNKNKKDHGTKKGNIFTYKFIIRIATVIKKGHSKLTATLRFLTTGRTFENIK